jgi:uncharacterized protein (TIGR02265 family)
VFGDEGVAEICAQLDADTRARTFDAPVPPPKWIAEADLIACSFAIWNGPARRDRAKYNAFLHKQVEEGTGRVQRALLSLASPKRVIDRAPSIWSAEHSHGSLTVEHTGERSAIVRLADHLYVETPQARATIAEVFRFIVSLSRAANVTEAHVLEDFALVVRLAWE